MLHLLFFIEKKISIIAIVNHPIISFNITRTSIRVYPFGLFYFFIFSHIFISSRCIFDFFALNSHLPPSNKQFHSCKDSQSAVYTDISLLVPSRQYDKAYWTYFDCQKEKHLLLALLRNIILPRLYPLVLYLIMWTLEIQSFEFLHNYYTKINLSILLR